ncbi:MAG: hypothetical protein CME62_10950 [Halobacteriovoraceae bacterium]|nr:hypothetical protein [Halobacteriovoraceae bacterium]|tara:strand:+ start:3970 stop:4983 length:1014 start_codon:yes stop_codon:yes gene_type:complete
MITCKNLSFRYGKRSTDGIQEINFEAAKNSVHAIIGPSGAGKTTLLKCLSGDITEYQGEIIFAEKASLGFLKNESLDSAEETVLNFLLKAISHSDQEEKDLNRVRTILSDLELTNEIDSQLTSLSSGQKQRLLIAKTLINNPTVLLLDEPFANLDNNLRDNLLKEFFALLKDKEITILWVTHNTHEALKFSDQILLMQYGQLEQLATPQVIYYEPKSIFAAQFFGENNILSARLIDNQDSHIRFELLNSKWQCSQETQIPYENFLMMIRPEFIYLDKSGPLKGRLVNKYFEGSSTLLELECSDSNLVRIIHPGVDHTQLNQVYSFNINPQGFYPLLG